ncbi:MAG: TonB-dependent receptor [Tidjanibacter sp.]|nr:TonB-dependent receptor [Tidjanibacter sp.]
MKNFTLKIALFLAMMGVGCGSIYAQQVRGTVKDTSGEPVIGATVMVDETNQGTITGVDGEYTIAVADPAKNHLTVSYLGMTTVTVAVDGRSVINFTLESEAEVFEDIVVIGYGTQKKSVVTAAISSISEDAIEKSAPTRIDNALRGLSSGVAVQQVSGAPGASSQVRIRGIGSINDSQPLYIVDGMALSGGIDYLNPSDIERVEVLKDAASAAVYGARAANGVILVTTKKGKSGDAVITYDYSYGMQNVWRKPLVLDATEYAIMMNEGDINAGKAPRYADPYSFGKGTDWVDAVLNKNAPVQQHQVQVSGASDKVNYMFSAGYFAQDGIVGGNYGVSNYDRLTLRANTQATLFDKSSSRALFNKATVSVNVSYANINSVGSVGESSEFGTVLGSAMAMSPLQAIYATEEEIEQYKEIFIAQPDGSKLYVFPHMIRDAEGKVYSMVDGGVYNELQHPLATMQLPATKYNTDKFVANAALDLQIAEGLTFRTSFGADLSFWGNHGYNMQYYRNQKSFNLDQVSEEVSYNEQGEKVVTYKPQYATSAYQQMNRSLRWQIENTLTYEKQIEDHNFQILLGQAAISQNGAQVGGSKSNLPEVNEYMANINFATGTSSDGWQSVYGYYHSTPYRLASYFARASYNYAEKYMLQATVRRDGSSRFGPNNKWGVFPSLSAGWNVKNEEFLQNIDLISAMKVRASWGKNGNDSIGDMRYTTTMVSGNNYPFGVGGTETIIVGNKPNGLANPNIKWEESVQTDLGVDLGFFNNSLTLSLDYYTKETRGMLMAMQVPSYAGDSAPIGNVGNMVNKGIEIDLGYRGRAGELNYGINANVSYNTNKLTHLGDESTYLTGDSHKIGTLTRGDLGMVFPYFWGWQTAGVFQNMDEVNAYTHTDAEGNTTLIQPNATPGDFRWVDINEDGIINEDDRTIIGKGTPDWTFGLNLTLEWRNFDFSAFLQGQAGNDVFNVSRRTDLYSINLPKNILNRWTGEGTTNSAPKFEFESKNENYRVSDYWLEDASFIRMRNIQLGYTLPANLTEKFAISRVRVYVSCDNLFTLTKYTGCDPEVTGGNSSFGTAYGIDRGVYPQARTLTFGANVTF